ncbi:hypothetical protein I545_6782 [Mycobacterium kansasii 662]|uniref:Uncharacterized protein n=1 Tax=Mycobacterium kansasii 662 TaxID=1299326 RepID=X7XT70_MYCKA|nr:hypothetical protein I545_6782 [Mycobacterium kansasii 662]
MPAGLRGAPPPTIAAALEHMIDIADHRSSAPEKGVSFWTTHH